MRNDYLPSRVQYWNHATNMADSLERSHEWTGKARTTKEAIRKAELDNIRKNGVGMPFRMGVAQVGVGAKAWHSM